MKARDTGCWANPAGSVSPTRRKPGSTGQELPEWLSSNFRNSKALLVRDGRLMALDVGSKTIGIATSDVLRMLATPLTTLKRSKLAVDLAALDRAREQARGQGAGDRPAAQHGRHARVRAASRCASS